jgi:hypothetical protein
LGNPSFAPKVQKEGSQWQAQHRLWLRDNKNPRSEGAPEIVGASSMRRMFGSLVQTFMVFDN